jgi:hypothetical protein
MIIHVIIAAWKKAIATRGLIDSILLQSCKLWKVYVVHDGPPEPDFAALKDYPEYQDPRIGFYNSEVKFGCYGHLNRKMFLESLIGAPDDFVLITNCDNYYVPYFVDIMLKECRSDVGIVYCNTVHSHQNYDLQVSQLRLSYIDMGAFIVKLSIAQEVGFKHYNYPAADGLYAEECLAKCTEKHLRAVHVNKPLFVHN